MLENLKKLRETAGTTQSALAAVIGISQQSINKYENLSIEPDIETLKRIADFFDTTISRALWRVPGSAKLNTACSSVIIPDNGII